MCCRYFLWHILVHSYFQLLVDVYCKQWKLNKKTNAFLPVKKASDKVFIHVVHAPER